MIIDVIGNKFSINIELHQINKMLFAKVREFMEENEYFHEEHFVEFLEEDDNFESVDNMSPAAHIVTMAQLEDWVEESALDSNEDQIPEEDIEDSDPEDDEDMDEDDDE